MSRKAGSKNADHEARRWALARKARPLVFSDRGARASVRQLAAAAGTTVSTLTHYFGDRAGLIRAVLQSQQLDAEPYLAIAAEPTSAELRASVERYVLGLRQAWFAHGVGNVEARALATGLSQTELGPTYVNAILEPLLQSFERLLTVHIARGQLAPCDVRFAALGFVAPIVFALLHQDSLSGKRCRPLDLDAFLARHLDVFVATHPVVAPPRDG